VRARFVEFFNNSSIRTQSRAAMDTTRNDVKYFRQVMAFAARATTLFSAIATHFSKQYQFALCD
jgi:hypothetical protein